MRNRVLLALAGVAIVLAAVAALATKDRPRSGSQDLPPLVRHVPDARGEAAIAMAPGSSSLYFYDEDRWPTEPWAPAARDAGESGHWVGSGAGVLTATLPFRSRDALPVQVSRVRRAPRPPRGGRVAWSTIDLPSGGLVISGTTPRSREHVLAVPPGAYRVRFHQTGIAFGAQPRLRLVLWRR